MEKQKFKQTEIGEIPEDWEVKVLGKSAILKARIGWQGLTTKEYRNSGEYFLITGTELKNGSVDWESCFYVDEYRYEQDVNIQVKNKDVLVTKDGTIGKVAIVRGSHKFATLNSGVFVIRPINNSFNPEFFYYVLRSSAFDTFLSQLTAGSTINHLYQKDFVHFNFPIPVCPQEQTAIATLLSDTDELLASLDKLIAKKKAIKQGLMQEFLKPKEGWHMRTLEELTKIFTKQTGFDYTAHIKPSLVKYKNNNTIPFIQNKDFNNKWINFKTDYYIPKSVAIKFPHILLDEKSLLISISGSIGNIGIYESNELAFIGGAIAILKFKNPKLIDWVMYFLKSDLGQSRLFGGVKSSSHQNLILEDIRKIEILFPEESERITTIKALFDMDSELESLEKKRDKYLMIKQGMMQQLLTGKIRLI